MLPSATSVVSFDEGELKFRGAAPLQAENVRLVEGVRGNGVYIGTNGVLRYAVPENLFSPTAVTVSVWFKFDHTPCGGTPFKDRDVAKDGTWQDFRKNLTCWDRAALFRTGNINLEIGTSYMGGIAGAGTAGNWIRQIFADEWHQFAATYEKTGFFRYYVDGRVAAEKKVSRPADVTWGKDMMFWSLPVAKGAGLTVDEATLLNRAMSPKEVENLYAEMRPYRTELLDYAVTAGLESEVRFREVEIRSGKIRDFRRKIPAQAPGLFRIVERGLTFELMALTPARPPETVSEEVIADFDCAKDYPGGSVYNDCGTHLVTNACGIYRECDSNETGRGMLYRFRVPHPGRPHWAEVTYPDDAKREYSFALYPEKFGRFYALSLDCAGIITGLDHPLSGRPQVKRLLFWPDSETVQLGILGYKPQRGSRPPAALRVRILEADIRSETCAGKRTVGIWDEDPTMDSSLAFNQSFNSRSCDLEFWRTKWQRTIDYMRYHGIGAWSVKLASYDGDVTALSVSLGEASPHARQSNSGRIPGWDSLGAKMFEDAGLDFYGSINLRTESEGGRNFIQELGGLGEGGDPGYFEQANGEKFKAFYNFLRPDVARGMRRLVAAYRDKFAGCGHFRGLQFIVGVQFHFWRENIGYDAFTVGRFASETGIAVPASDAKGRYRWLKDNRWREWLDWRCRKVTAFTELLARELNAGTRKDLEIHFGVGPMLAELKHDNWPDVDLKETLCEAGVDLAALNALPNVRALPAIDPDNHRATGSTGVNYPYLIYADEETALLREGQVTAANIMRHSNLEIFPDMTAQANAWRHPFPVTVGGNVPGVPDFADYATPHPVTRYTLESAVHLLAECDVQDFWHGWWGVPEAGEHEAWRCFYRQFRAIPRGRFEPLALWRGDPVAIRVSCEGKGWYAVNREGFGVTLVLPSSRRMTLGPCDVRYVPEAWTGSGAEVRVEVSPEALAPLDARLKKMRAIAKLRPSDKLLAEVTGKAERAFGEGRYMRARSLCLTRVARNAIFANEVSVRPKFDLKTRDIVIRVDNLGARPFAGTFRLNKSGAREVTAKRETVSFTVPARGFADVRFPLDMPPKFELNPYMSFVFALSGDGGTEETFTWNFPPIRARDVKTAPAFFGLAAGKAGWANGYVQTFADGERLRVTVNVKDDDFFEPQTEGHMYTHDSIQVYFDQCNNARIGQAPGYDDDDLVFQVGVLNGKPTVFMEYPKRQTVEAAVAKVTRANGLTTYVVDFPKFLFDRATLKPAPLNVIGFGLLVNQTYKSADGAVEHESYSFFGNPYLHPENWMDLYLEDK